MFIYSAHDSLSLGCFFRRFVIFSVPLFLISGNLLAAGVTLSWDSVPNAGGYKVYYGPKSGNYESNIDVGNQTSHRISELKDGKDYYFAVKAYNPERTTESVFSNEVTVAAGNNKVKLMSGDNASREYSRDGKSDIGHDDTPNQSRQSINLVDGLSNTAINGKLKLITKGKRDGLSIKVSVDYPNESLGLKSRDNIEEATILATFKDSTGQAQAECELELGHVSNGKVEYELKLKRRGNHLREKKGSCDIDLSDGDNITPGMPVLQPGGQMVIELEDPNGNRLPISSGATS